MATANKEATIEEYMELVKEGDHDKVVQFIYDCFGTEDDFNSDACDAFAVEAQPVLQTFLEEEIKKMPEATPEMMEEAKNSKQTGETPVATETTEAPAVEEAANDSGETPESASEATDAS